MRRSVASLLVLSLVFAIVLAPGLYAQAKKDTKTGEDRISGTVQSVDKDKSVITVQQSSGARAVWQIMYNKDTKFTYRNNPSSIDDVKEGRRVICLGKFESGQVKMTASRVDVREGKE